MGLPPSVHPRSCLYVASQWGFEQICRALVDAGADDLDASLAVAIARCHDEVASMLRLAGAEATISTSASAPTVDLTLHIAGSSHGAAASNASQQADRPHNGTGLSIGVREVDAAQIVSLKPMSGSEECLAGGRNFTALFYGMKVRVVHLRPAAHAGAGLYANVLSRVKELFATTRHPNIALPLAIARAPTQGNGEDEDEAGGGVWVVYAWEKSTGLGSVFFFFFGCGGFGLD